MKKRAILLTSLLLTTGLVSCSQSGSSTGASAGSKAETNYNSAPSGSPGSLTGTAATGAAIPNALISIKCGDQSLLSTRASATGKWSKNVDEESCAGPYLIRATGSVRGKVVDLLSAATDENIGKIVNITPMTHFVTANLVGQTNAATGFGLDHSILIDKTKIDTQKNKLKTALAEVIKAATGKDDISEIDFMEMPFSTDHTGMDAILDIVKVDIAGNNMSVKLSTASETEVFVADATAPNDPISPASIVAELSEIQETNSRYVAVASKLKDFVNAVKANAPAIASSTSVSNLPASVKSFFSSTFLEDGLDATAFSQRAFALEDGLAEYNQEVAPYQIDFGNVAMVEKVAGSGIYTVFFDLMFDGELKEMGNMVDVQESNGTYKLHGNQVETNVYVEFKIYKELKSVSGAPGTKTIKYKMSVGTDADEEISINGTPVAFTKVKNSSGVDILPDVGVQYDDLGNPVTGSEQTYQINQNDAEITLGNLDTDYTEYSLELFDASMSLLKTESIWIKDPRESFNEDYFPEFVISSTDASQVSSFVEASISESNVDSYCLDNGVNLAVNVSQSDYLQLEYLYAFFSQSTSPWPQEQVHTDIEQGSNTTGFTKDLSQLTTQDFKDMRAYHNGPGSQYVLNIMCE